MDDQEYILDSKDITAIKVVLDVEGMCLNPSLILVCSGKSQS